MEGPRNTEEKIRVSVRVRPLNRKELQRNDVSEWECIDGTTVIYKNNHQSISDRSMYPSSYSFDRVFGPECSTNMVYEQGAKEVALSVVSGVNASIFAYGQTSSGKTYTMSGITDYTMADIFDYIEKHKERDFVMKFSAMEIYNESVRDLLSTDNSPLRVLDDPEKGTVVEKLTEEILQDWDHFKGLLSVCQAQRQIGETALNEVSSRSHQILRLTIESTAHEYTGNDKLSTLTATVNFIDLAGSERASQSLSAGSRLKEGCHINRSLLALGTVIRKLSKGKTGHVPFRDSKLTRILHSSLGGNARTSIICTMSPARVHVEQSRNTLLFASCAKEVTISAQVNVVVSDKALVKHLQRELNRLESELRGSERVFVPPDTAALLMEKDLLIEKLKDEVFELTQQLEIARAQIMEYKRMVDKGKQPEIEISSIESTEENMEHEYPKLRVRESWDVESGTVESPLSDQPSSISPRTEHSYDENVFQLSDCRIDSGASSPPPLVLSSGTPGEETVEKPRVREEADEEHVRNSEDKYKEVRCVEMEESGSSHGYPEEDTVECSPLPVCKADSQSSIPSTEEEEEVEEVKEVSETSLHKSEDSGRIKTSPGYVFSSPGLSYPHGKLNRDLYYLRKVPRPPDTPYSNWLLERDSMQTLRSMKSRSCRSSLLSSGSSFSWFERDDKSPRTVPSSWYKKDFMRTSPSTRTTPTVLQRDVNGDSSVLDLQNYSGGRSPNNEKTERRVAESMIHNLVEGMEEKRESRTASNRDKGVAWDTIRDYLATPLNWEMEFKRLQKEMLELWHACNVSLGHRTYLFLCFKGDQKDCLFMEVEIRRLNHIRESFQQGGNVVEEGCTLSPTSSMRALNKERYKLSELMQKKLKKEERENLFLRWGIGLKTKHRRVQLAHRLWSDTKDLEHVRESASVVGKLLGFVQSDMDSSHMVPPPQAPKKSGSRWKRSVLSLSFL